MPNFAIVTLLASALSVIACAPTQDCSDGSCGGGTGGTGGSGGSTGGGSGGAAASCDAGTGALDAWQQGILDAQNVVRANASPVPSPALAPFTWNATARCVAQAWAERCTFEHNLGQHGYGENLAASTDVRTPSQAVQGWADEVADYDYASNTCAPNTMCGHYTQLVWRSSTSVGCATVRCTQNSPFGDGRPWTFVVCDYAPPGNYRGQKPY